MMEVVTSNGYETILPEFWGGGVGFVRVMYKTDRAARISFGNDRGGLARDADLVIRE